MLPATGSTMTRGDLARRRAANARFDLRRGRCSRARACAPRCRRHAGRGRLAERERARARLDEQRVAVAVVAAFELHDLRAAGEAAREADRGHRRLGAGGHEPHQLERRHAAAQSVSASSISASVGAPKERPCAAAACTARRPPDARGRRSAGPTSRRSRCSACRRRPTRARPRRARRSAACRRPRGTRAPAN